MRRPFVWMTAVALAAGLAASGCRRTEQGEIVVDEEVEEGAEAAGQATREGLREAGEAAEEGLQRAGEAAQEGLDRAEARLQPVVDDAVVTARVKARLAADPEVAALRIDVDTVAGVVTLNGQVASEAARAGAE